jgi:hypothetical protein
VSGPTPDDGLDFAPRHAPERDTLSGFRQRRRSVCREVLATRKPAALLSLPGRFVLRLAERTFAVGLSNAPPRNKRLLGRLPAERVLVEQPLTQSLVHDQATFCLRGSTCSQP